MRDPPARPAATDRKPTSNSPAALHRNAAFEDWAANEGGWRKCTMVSAAMVVATVPVSDLARAKVFYGETLGLTFLWENPASIRFRCGDKSDLSIFRRPSTVPEHTLAHFEVTDLESEVADLETRGRSIQRATSHNSAQPARPGSATPMETPWDFDKARRTASPSGDCDPWFALRMDRWWAVVSVTRTR